MDLCVADATQCGLQNAYKDYCYTQFDLVLSQTNMSLDEFVPWWTAKVADALDLNQKTLESLYSDDDPYNTNSSVRDFWKFGTSSGVAGTPAAFVNGVRLDSVPTSVDDWMALLNDVYGSQYQASLVEEEPTGLMQN